MTMTMPLTPLHDPLPTVTDERVLSRRPPPMRRPNPPNTPPDPPPIGAVGGGVSGRVDGGEELLVAMPSDGGDGGREDKVLPISKH
jgi:hypothetical protein